MRCSRVFRFLTCLLLVVMLMSVVCFSAFAKVSVDELNEYAEPQPVSDKTTTTTVTATTSDGKTETYDIVIDPEYYDISFVPNSVSYSVPGFTGTAIETKSDMYADVTKTYRYIEHIVVPDGITAISTCSGQPSIIVVPKSVTAIARFFGSFNTMKDPEQVRQLFLSQRDEPGGIFRSCAYNDYYPYLLVLYEGTEAEWQKISTPDYVNGVGETRPNEARVLYEKGYVRFNCNYYDLTGTGSKPTEPAPATPSTPAANTVGGFADVLSSAYYANAVTWAVEQGITTGVTSTTFQPNSTCTQAQILTFLWRSKGCPTVSETAPLNISSDKYYFGAVNWGYANGIIGDDFSPNDACTRATAVDYIYKSEGSPDISGSNAFTDVNAGESYVDAVTWAVEQGVTTGVTSTTFQPSKTCTRAQIVTFLYRALA